VGAFINNLGEPKVFGIIVFGVCVGGGVMIVADIVSQLSLSPLAIASSYTAIMMSMSASLLV
jgi:hypothetical protein